MASTVEELRAREYQQRRDTTLLRQAVFTSAPDQDLLDRLSGAEAALAQIEQERAAAETAAGPDLRATLGLASSALEATYTLNMAQVPTAIYHLLDATSDPLVSGLIKNRAASGTRRLRVTAYLEGYSASAVDTLEIDGGRQMPFRLLPTLFPDRIRTISELTRASLNVLVEELGEGTGIELHRTTPVWLLPRTTAPMAVRDPETGGLRDFTRYLGVFVTPNDPEIMGFLRTVADRHPDGQLIGYQAKTDEEVTSQIRAIFDALRVSGRIRYVNSIIAFTPDDAVSAQRVRLPTESLRDHEANCLDGTVLAASLIEAASMNAAIVIIPGHAFVAWERGKTAGQWGYLETTMIGGTDDFEAACARAESYAATFETLATHLNDPTRFRRWSVRELRGQRITPLS